MIFKMLGALLLFAGSGGMGFYMVTKYEENLSFLKELALLTEYLMEQIERECASLPEAICRVSCRMDGEIGEMLENNAKKLQENDGKALFDIWKQEIGKRPEWEERPGAKELSALFEQTGFYDTKTQKNRFMEQLQFFKTEIEKMEKEKKDKCRLFQSLGVMTGLFIVILLW